MTQIWKLASRLRPEAYLDWQVRTSTADDCWCPVLVEILSEPVGGLLPGLQELASSVDRGRIEDDPPSTGKNTIRMSIEERSYLQQLLSTYPVASKSGAAGSGPAKALFFVYRPESLTYSGGQYSEARFFRVIFAGPPISDPDLNNTQFEPSPALNCHPRAETHPLPASEVAIGIIDDGIAFAHERFLMGPEKTRIQAIWLQDTERPQGCNLLELGRRLDREQIDSYLGAGISEQQIYTETGQLDFTKSNHKSHAYRVTHGTHVLDLAAGYDPRLACRDRPIFAVQLPAKATADTSGTTLGSYMLQGMHQIMLWADRYKSGIPLVINFSYGFNAGPKDGNHPLERAMTALVQERNLRGASTFLVLPAGNSYSSKATARLTLGKKAQEVLDWVILPDDRTPSYFELWLTSEKADGSFCPVSIGIKPPGGLPLAVQKLSAGTVQVLEDNGQPIAALYAESQAGPGGNRIRIVLAVNPTALHDAEVAIAPAGRWEMEIANITSREVLAHAYVQRDDTPGNYPLRGRQSYLDHSEAYDRDPQTGNYNLLGNTCPITTKDTLSAIATDAGTLVVGATQVSDRNLPAQYTSSGPSLGRVGPDCAAFSDEGDAHQGIMAAGTYGGSMVALRGTSMAAPQIVRKLADCLSRLEAATESGPIKTPAELVSAIAALNGQTLAVDPMDQPRLGKFIFQRSSEARLPKRRFVE